MDKAELLGNLNGLVDKYEQHRKYIEKARAQAAKFSSGVIEKVILDHEIKSTDVAEGVAPLLPQLRARVAELDADKAKIAASKGTVDEQIQELELRQAIGELEDAEFESQVGELRSNASSANERIAAIEADLGELNAAAERWIALAEPAGHYSAPVALAPALAPVAVEDGEPYSGRVELKEDMSSVFVDSSEGPATVRVSDVSDDIAIEAGEIGEDSGDIASAEVQFSAGLGDGPVIGEVEIEIGGDEPKVSGAPIELSEPAPIPASDDGTQRRALLIYQESTAEEQIYPFTNDQLTIGRGRENDIQIKNDSKVSRYHCKLFRRGNNFYVEDIKSSNGTLVNGELITDRRLFGGEEIVVGETYFRFRIME